jgi:hypothetical protein
MSTPPIPAPAGAARASLHDRFLAILPRVERHGQVFFRHLRCPGRKEDAIAEMVALAWKWHLRLAERGKDARQFPSALAAYAARAVKSGRRLCGQERAKDALSPLAQRRHAFTTSSLPAAGSRNGNDLGDALFENTRSPVPEQVSFRIDFPRWHGMLPQRDRDLVDDLLAGERTSAVSQKYGLSPGRISQKRRQFLEDWRRFCAPPEGAPALRRGRCPRST